MSNLPLIVLTIDLNSDLCQEALINRLSNVRCKSMGLTRPLASHIAEFEFEEQQDSTQELLQIALNRIRCLLPCARILAVETSEPLASTLEYWPLKSIVQDPWHRSWAQAKSTDVGLRLEGL